MPRYGYPVDRLELRSSPVGTPYNEWWDESIYTLKDGTRYVLRVYPATGRSLEYEIDSDGTRHLL